MNDLQHRSTGPADSCRDRGVVGGRRHRLVRAGVERAGGIQALRVLLALGGAFTVFEGLVGWCAIRAMGVKTPF